MPAIYFISQIKTQHSTYGTGATNKKLMEPYSYSKDFVWPTLTILSVNQMTGKRTLAELSGANTLKTLLIKKQMFFCKMTEGTLKTYLSTFKYKMQLGIGFSI